MWTEFPKDRVLTPSDPYWLRLLENRTVSLKKQLSSIVINQCCLRCCNIESLVTRLNDTIQFVRTHTRAPLTPGLFPDPGVHTGLYERVVKIQVVRQHFENSLDAVCQDWIVHFLQNVPSRLPPNRLSFDQASTRMTRLRDAYLRNCRPTECKVCDIRCPFQPNHPRRLHEVKVDSSVVFEHASSRSSTSALWFFCKYCVGTFWFGGQCTYRKKICL